MTDQFSAARIADRLMIQDVIYKFCRAVDRLDRQGMLDVFHDDARDNHGPYNGPVVGLVDWILKRHIPIPISSHFVGNIIIEFVSENTALVETYVRTIQQYPTDAKLQLAQFTGGPAGPDDKTVDIMTSSRYLDRFERRNSLWRIANRTVIQDWKGLFPVEQNALSPQEGWIVGLRNGEDAVQLARAELGLSGKLQD